MTMQNNSFVAEASNLRVCYRVGRGRYFEAVRGMDLKVGRGEFFALLGPNGAGKTTCMLTMLGFIAPSAGEVRLLGNRPEPGAAVYEKVAYLPEEPLYPEFLTVREVMEYYASLYRARITAGRIGELLERLGLSNRSSFLVRECSKGMRQRLGIAACMLNSPDLYFFDELTRGLDPLMLRSLREVMKDLHRSGATIVMNSHMLSEVETLCTSAAIMNKGKVVRHDTLNNLVGRMEGRFMVETGDCPDFPEFAQVSARDNGRAVMEVAREHLTALLEFCDRQGLEFYGCRQKTRTLEDIVCDLVEDDR
ncbi:MAG: ABC transporter ATP-binding protein [Candidatus Wallbacteria bacterium]|nr:ABC transporter ATP-binding protein [Candidatus Wallbacteria bacterium]